MKVAPIDIAHKTFGRKVMGLDADEVGDFLRDIADQMEETIRERNMLKEALRQKDMALMEYKERDASLKATMVTATKMSDQIRHDAEREAKLIVADAHQKADIILRDSRDSLKRVYQEISDIKRVRMQFEVNLRAVCQAHMAMIDQSHLSMPDPQVNLAQAQAAMNPGMNQAMQNQANHQANQMTPNAQGAGASVAGPSTMTGFNHNSSANMASSMHGASARGQAPRTAPTQSSQGHSPGHSAVPLK